MRLDRFGRRIRLARAGAAVVLASALVLQDAPAYAQRRQGEPEANPDFQNQVQNGGNNGGGPVGDAGGAPAGDAASAPGGAATPQAAAPGGGSPAPASDTPSAAESDKLIEPRSVQSVQIGAAPAAAAVDAAPTNPLDTRVTVRVKGVPLATFLDTISAQAKVNFIITEGLEQRRVTAFLQNVTVREALQVLLEIKGLTYQQIGKSSTYVVTQRSRQAENLITRIYTLSYIPLIPLSTDDSPDSKTNAAGGAGAGAGSNTGASTSGGRKPCAGKNQLITIARVLCGVLTQNGDIETEPRTNALIITDIPEVFPQVEQIIAELDKKATQVLIETQIVEIDSTRTRNLGFEWGGANGELGTFTGGERDTTFPLNLPNNLSQTRFFDPLAGVISSIGSSGGSGSSSSSSSGSTGSTGGSSLVFGSYIQTSVLNLTSLTVTLRALVENAEARFLGKPKVLTLNNKSATIEITQNQAVAIQSTINGSQGVSQSVSQAERYQTGVKLKVTPQVNKDGYITMLLQPEFANVQASVISTAANPTFDPLTRKTNTLVRVKNGQTVVIGGLLESNENKTVRKVPFLGYIPLIGWLFTSTLYNRTNTDLVIFITPTIVSD
jgi:type IV pilus secretin PilQ/predicted competence protein